METEVGSRAWGELNFLFWRSLDTLEALSVENGVLLLRRDFLSVLARISDDNLVRCITIDVQARSPRPVDPDLVEHDYARALKEYGVPESPYGLGLDEVWHKGVLRIMVRPPDPQIYDPGADILPSVWDQQPPFPPPSRIRDHYASALRHAKECGFADVGDKTGGNPSKAYNLISACVAWYVAGCDKNSGQPKLPTETRKFVHGFFAKLPNPPPQKTNSTLKRDVEAMAPLIRSLDAELRSESNRRSLARLFGQNGET